VCVCVCKYVRAVTFERNNQWRIYLACWSIVSLSASTAKVKVVGQSSRSTATATASAVCMYSECVHCWRPLVNKIKPGIIRIQELADISRSALCCHNNETRAPIANPFNTAQLEGTPIIPTSYIRMIRVRAVVWECGEGQTDRHIDRHTDGRGHFASATTHAKCNYDGHVKVTQAS